MVVMLSTQCLCSKIICASHRGALNQDNMSSRVLRRVSQGQIRGRCPRTAELLPDAGYCEVQTAEEAAYECKGYVVPANTRIQRFECLIKTHVITLTFEWKGAMRWTTGWAGSTGVTVTGAQRRASSSNLSWRRLPAGKLLQRPLG